MPSNKYPAAPWLPIALCTTSCKSTRHTLQHSTTTATCADTTHHTLTLILHDTLITHHDTTLRHLTAQLADTTAHHHTTTHHHADTTLHLTLAAPTLRTTPAPRTPPLATLLPTIITLIALLILLHHHRK